MDERQLRQLLPRTYYPFFARFGRARSVQLATAQPVLEGRDVFVCSPAATGKTEAITAPLCERILGTGKCSRILYVCPTRALVNDIWRRLEGPVTACGLTLGRRTSDHARKWPRMPRLVITTPESLDSLLSRQINGLRDVVAVVLDELHLLDNTARGDQLRMLLQRLRGHVAGGLQVCGASATSEHSFETASRYLIQPHIVQEDLRRPIDATMVLAATVSQVAAAIAEVYVARKNRKLLVFLNARQDVETVSAMLGQRLPPATPVFAHHGSLSRGERERTERAFHRTPGGICVATMTLELGIDIGDIDLVVLVAPPPSVASLLQRTGRGDRRRAGATRLLACCRHAGDLVRFEHLLQCAAGGRLCEPTYVFRSSVLVQQALSITFETPGQWVSPQSVHTRVPTDVQKVVSRHDLKSMLNKLADAGWLRPVSGDRYVAEPELERLFRQGRIHSNIADDKDRELEVVDELTGRLLGRFLVKGEADEVVAFGGRQRELVRVRDRTLYVRTSGIDGVPPRFVTRERPAVSFQLAQDLKRFVGIHPAEVVLLEVDGGWHLFHFLGTIWGHIYAACLAETCGKPPTRPRALSHELAHGPIDTVPSLSLTHVRSTMDRHRKRLLNWVGVGPYHKHLPESMADGLVERAVDPQALVTHCTALSIRKNMAEELSQVLAALVGV